MSFTTNSIIQLAISGVILFLSTQLLFGSVPHESKDRPYYPSRRFMGCAIGILPIFFIVYFFVGIYKADILYAKVFNMCGCYLSSALVHLSMLALLGEDINTKSRNFRLYIFSFFALPLFMQLGFALLGAVKTITIVNTLLYALILFQFLHLHHKYNTIEERKRDHKYVDEIYIHMAWFKKNVYLFVILAIVTCISPSFFYISEWFTLATLGVALLIFVYIYESYHRFVVNYIDVNHNGAVIEVEPLDEEPLFKAEVVGQAKEEPQQGLTQDQLGDLSKRVNAWVRKKGYCKCGLTIQSVASDLYTNRTYLSLYVNSEYKCSFKVWVTNMRLEEAKKLILANPKYTMVKVANMVGFSSSASFIHVFRNSEGVSPAKWRLEKSNIE